MSEAQLDALGRVTRLLAAADVEHWLFGGWAVDFHTGRVTRAHGDIDVFVRDADRERALGLLTDAGWDRVAPDAAQAIHLERDGQHLELASPPARLPDPAATTAYLSLGGITCPVLGRELLVALKAETVPGLGRELEARDARDLALLLGAPPH